MATLQPSTTEIVAHLDTLSVTGHAGRLAAVAAAAATAGPDPGQQQQQQQLRKPPTTNMMTTSKAWSLLPERWADQVRTIDISEYKEAGLSLAQAFATDGLAQYLLDADDMADVSIEARWRLHVDVMTFMTSAHCYSGLVTAIGPDYEGVALWAPPGTTTEDWLTTLRSGMWRLYFRLTAGGRHRLFGDLLPRLHKAMDDVLGTRAAECYYLVYLGTKPSGRRRGYARKLIEAMAVKADAENRPMYLESSSDKNTAYYRKFGFETKGEILFGDADEAGVGGEKDEKEVRPAGDPDSSASSSFGSDGGSSDEDDAIVYQDPGRAMRKQRQKKPPVRLTLMVREPQPPLFAGGGVAKSIPIKLGAGFKGL